MNGDGKIVFMNAKLQTLFGYHRNELLGKAVELLVPQNQRDWHLKTRLAFQNTDQRKLVAASKMVGLRKDGSTFPTEVNLNPFRIGDQHFTMATVTDLTERVEADRVQKDFRRKLLQVQERERLRLAHELHDQTAPNITAMMLELKTLENVIPQAGEGSVHGLRAKLDQMALSLHHVAWELRPASMDELGLENALSNYIMEWSDQHKIEVDFNCRCRAIDKLAEEIRTTVYRVVQEALTNVAKHAAGCTVVSIVIDHSELTLQVIVEDNGKGFDVSAQLGGFGTRKGLGLGGMRERVLLIDGSVDIESLFRCRDNNLR